MKKFEKRKKIKFSPKKFSLLHLEFQYNLYTKKIIFKKIIFNNGTCSVSTETFQLIRHLSPKLNIISGISHLRQWTQDFVPVS